MNKWIKQHLTNLNRKIKDIRELSGFLKHIKNTNGGQKGGECFKDNFGEINIGKAYKTWWQSALAMEF